MSKKSIERFQNAIFCEKTDRPPLGYLFFGGGKWVLDYLGVSFSDVYYKANGIVKAQTMAQKMFQCDNVMSPWGCLTIEAEAFGCRIQKMKDDYPRIVERIIKSENDLKTLSVPNPHKNGRMPLILESLRLLQKECGHRVPVIGVVCSPFIVASELIGLENILADTLLKPDFVHKLLDVATAACVDYVIEMIEQNIFAVMIENAYMNKTFLNVKDCKKFVFNYSEKLGREIKKHGVYVIEHNCSKEPYLDMSIELNPDILNFGSGDILTIKKQAPNLCLMGKVDHAHTVFYGTKYDVYKDAKRCLREGGPHGFILSTGCEIPFNAPLDNIRALAEVVKEGWPL